MTTATLFVLEDKVHGKGKTHGKLQLAAIHGKHLGVAVHGDKPRTLTATSFEAAIAS